MRRFPAFLIICGGALPGLHILPALAAGTAFRDMSNAIVSGNVCWPNTAGSLAFLYGFAYTVAGAVRCLRLWRLSKRHPEQAFSGDSGRIFLAAGLALLALPYIRSVLHTGSSDRTEEVMGLAALMLMVFFPWTLLLTQKRHRAARKHALAGAIFCAAPLIWGIALYDRF